MLTCQGVGPVAGVYARAARRAPCAGGRPWKLRAARARCAQAGAVASSEGLRSEDSSSAACEGAALAHLSGSGSGSAGTGARGAGRARVKDEAHDSPDEHPVGLSKQELKRAQNRRIQHRFREKERVRAPARPRPPRGSARRLGALRQDPGRRPAASCTRDGALRRAWPLDARTACPNARPAPGNECTAPCGALRRSVPGAGAGELRRGAPVAVPWACTAAATRAGPAQARKKELETKATLWDERGAQMQREMAALREENLRLTHSMQARARAAAGPRLRPRCRAPAAALPHPRTEPHPRGTSLCANSFIHACAPALRGRTSRRGRR